MEIINQIPASPLPIGGSAVCIGVFDGVHFGHQKIIHSTVDAAKRHKLTSVAVTFYPSPGNVLKKRESTPLIIPLAERLRRIAVLGVDRCLVIPFDRKFSRTSPKGFVANVLHDKLKARIVCVGRNFCFGRDASGNIGTLDKLGGIYGYKLKTVLPVKRHGAVVSSTAVRNMIRGGRLAEARDSMGAHVLIGGRVQSGHGIGRTIGFPTVNFLVEKGIMPPYGVYAAGASIGGRNLLGGLFLGPRHVIKDGRFSAEIHLINLHKQLNINEIEVYILQKIREVVSFKSLADLKAQIDKDVRHIVRIGHKIKSLQFEGRIV